MKNLQLNTFQINLLLEQHFLEISKKTAIIIHQDELILSHNGILLKPLKISISFNNKCIPENEDVKHIRKIICEHFYLEPYKVIFLTKNKEEYKFEIRFTPNQKSQLIVCEFRQALINNNEIFELSKNQITKTQIGLYRKLGKSAYYFHWTEE